MTSIDEKEFKKLRKKYMPQYIIQMHTKGEINLSSQQLNEVLEFKKQIENIGRRDINEKNKKSKA